MKHSRVSFLILCGFLLFNRSAVYGQFALSTGVRADLFTEQDTSEIDGAETTIPIGLAYQTEELAILFETAYSRATVNPGTDADAELAAFTDARLSASYTFTGLPTTGIILGFDMNLPMGAERLDASEREAEAGENNDLLEVDDFGEGFNYGASFGLMQEFYQFNLGAGVAYIFTGEYDPTEEIDNDTFDPGDQIFVTAQSKWLVFSTDISWMTLETFASYGYTFEDTEEGQEIFQEGGQWIAGGALQTNSNWLQVTMQGQYFFRAKNKELEAGSLQTESENSNGQVLFGNIDALVKCTPRLSLRVLADVRYYDESERKENGIPAESRRIRYAAGPGFEYSMGAHLTLNGLAKYFRMTQEPDMFLDQQTTYHGGHLSFSITYRL